MTPAPHTTTWRGSAIAVPYCASLLAGGHSRELSLQAIDSRKVARDVVVAALLAGRQPEGAARVDVARAGAAQVDDRGQVLLLLERGGGDALARQRARDAAIQER